MNIRERAPTVDEQAGMTWWNALSEGERRQKLEDLIGLKREPTVANACELENRNRGHCMKRIFTYAKLRQAIDSQDSVGNNNTSTVGQWGHATNRRISLMVHRR